MVSKIIPSNVVKPGSQAKSKAAVVTVDIGTISSDVIDLGGPPAVHRAVHGRRRYIPNPRLYPGPKLTRKLKKLKKHTRSKKSVKVNQKEKTKKKRKAASKSCPSRRKRLHRCSVPNSRLYVAPPQRRRPPPKPPAVPPVPWLPPPSRAPAHTASTAALHLAQQRIIDSSSTIDPYAQGTQEPISYVAAQAFAWPSVGRVPAESTFSGRAQSPRLVVTLPGSPPTRSRESIRSQPPTRIRQSSAHSGPFARPPQSARSGPAARPPQSVHSRFSAHNQATRPIHSTRSRLSSRSRRDSAGRFRVHRSPLPPGSPEHTLVSEVNRHISTAKQRSSGISRQESPALTRISARSSISARSPVSTQSRKSSSSPISARLRGPIPPKILVPKYNKSPGRQQTFTTLPGPEPAPVKLGPEPYKPRSFHFRQRALDPESGESPPPAARVQSPQVSSPRLPQQLSSPKLSPRLSSPRLLLPRVPEPASVTPVVCSLMMSGAPRRTASRSDGGEGTDGSDGNDSQSAPSELLAEFLSSIMQRNYEEALKYCQLILHYEPNNAAARGFYPLLQHKLEGGKDEGAAGTAAQRSWSSEESSSPEVGGAKGGTPSPRLDLDDDEEEEDESDSDSCASLSLDSSGHSFRSVSPVSPPSPAPPHTLSESRASGVSLSGSTGSGPHSSAAGPTSADGSPPSAEADDNGNPLCFHQADDDDLENDNAAGGDHTPLLKDTSLQQLRAQFACSIK